jgi:hypothetical protein
VDLGSSLPPGFLLEGGYFFELLSGEIYCPFLTEEEGTTAFDLFLSGD